MPLETLQALLLNPEVAIRLREELDSLSLGALRQSYLSFRRYAKHLPDAEQGAVHLQEAYDFAALATALRAITQAAEQ